MNYAYLQLENFLLTCKLVRSAPLAGSAPWVQSLCKRKSMKSHKMDLTHLLGSTPELGHCVNAVLIAQPRLKGLELGLELGLGF